MWRMSPRNSLLVFSHRREFDAMGSSDDRIIRVVIGSLLGSDVSLRDLRQFAEDLRLDPETSERLGRVLEASLNGMNRTPTKGFQPVHGESRLSNRFADQLLSLVEARGVTASDLTDLIRGLLPNWVHGKRWSKRQIIDAFVAEAPQGVIAALNQRISGADPAPDAYLTGLQNRNPK